MWKNEINLVHATCFQDIWSADIDSISKRNRYDLINQLTTKDVIQ
uniref:Uncharacterized protein n=2 Tax=Chryseobacterium TaxID=59732 RepID=A0AAU6WTZ9_9FLAO